MSGRIGMDDSELLNRVKYAEEEIPCIYGVIDTLVDEKNKLNNRIDELEAQLQHILQFISGGVNKTTRRAYLLADAVKVADGGFITRAQARNVLIEDGKKPATKTTDDAMTAAADMFGLIYTKNQKGHVVLAVRK